MPRIARLVVPGVALHIVQRGHDGRACFRQDSDRLVYLSNLREMCIHAACSLHAYCLMTNHVHLLLTPSDESGCACPMRNLGQRYVQYFNKRYHRRGTLWEGRFYSRLVDSAACVIACYRYIERNPIRAGMVDAAIAYPWSSYNGNGGYSRNDLLRPHAEYEALGADMPSRHVRDATHGGFPLVGNDLKARLQVTGRPLERRKRGPKKHKSLEDPLAGLQAMLGLRPETS